MYSNNSNNSIIKGRIRNTQHTTVESEYRTEAMIPVPYIQYNPFDKVSDVYF